MTETVPPRGRPVIATLGILIIVGGFILSALVMQNGWIITGLGPISNNTSDVGTFNNPTATPDTFTPHGTAPANFVTYSDGQRRFTLYYSKTWTHQQGMVNINGKAEPTTSFVPVGTKLPAWQIAFPASVITADQFIATVTATLATQGGTDFTPTNGPSATTIGSNDWTELDGTVTISGQLLKMNWFVRPTSAGTGSVLVMATAPSFNFDAPNMQDFIPMLTSITLGV